MSHDPRDGFKAFDSVAITNGNTKKSVVTTRSADALGSFTWGIKSTETVAALALTVRLEFNNRSKSRYAIDCGWLDNDTPAQKQTKEDANTAGWFQHDLSPTTTVAFAGTASHDITVSRKSWKRCRLVAVCTGGTGTLDADGAVL